MTTIAYRSGVLACDSAWSVKDEYLVSSATKLVRLGSGNMYAAAGDCDDRDLVSLLQSVEFPSQLPSAREICALGVDVTALVVFHTGHVWIIDTNGEHGGAFPIEAEFAAIGSGAKFALGAMQVGARAKGAVLAACELDVFSRGPVHTMELRKEGMQWAA